MDYVTTNIRIPEEDYLRLKAEAARQRKSFAEIVRQYIAKSDDRSQENREQLKRETDKLALRIGNKVKRFNALKSINTMRQKRSDRVWKQSTRR